MKFFFVDYFNSFKNKRLLQLLQDQGVPQPLLNLQQEK